MHCDMTLFDVYWWLWMDWSNETQYFGRRMHETSPLLNDDRLWNNNKIMTFQWILLIIWEFEMARMSFVFIKLRWYWHQSKDKHLNFIILSIGNDWYSYNGHLSTSIDNNFGSKINGFDEFCSLKILEICTFSRFRVMYLRNSIDIIPDYQLTKISIVDVMKSAVDASRCKNTVHQCRWISWKSAEIH